MMKHFMSKKDLKSGLPVRLDHIYLGRRRQYVWHDLQHFFSTQFHSLSLSHSLALLLSSYYNSLFSQKHTHIGHRRIYILIKICFYTFFNISWGKWKHHMEKRLEKSYIFLFSALTWTLCAVEWNISHFFFWLYQ